MSSYLALKSIKKYNFKNVLIHDAARPDFSIILLKRILKNLKKNICVIPMIKSNDSIKLKDDNKFINMDRKKDFFSQTPQGFNYKELLKLQKVNNKVTEDASLFIDANKKVIETTEKRTKTLETLNITESEDTRTFRQKYSFKT